ncbi:MAG TPA: CHAT domain-containing tetratricopeptide repeat protein, partial [Blastocatellia bacterium]|nr:CHAT domain-containing tetratricopeptide repeat protein [Blastocatellia bacterium]
MTSRDAKYFNALKLSSGNHYFKVMLMAVTLLSWVYPCGAENRPAGQPAQINTGSRENAPDRHTAGQLEAGKPIERKIAGGETHSYKVRLGAGQFLRVIVDQRGVDLVAALFAPDGKPVVEMDSPNGAHGPEPVLFVADNEGDYLIEVRSLTKETPAGRYEIRVEELRAAIENDHKLVAAERAFSEAERLRARGTAESFRLALEKYGEALPLMRDIGNRKQEAYTLGGIGTTYQRLMENQEALKYYNQALPLLQEVGDHFVEAEILINTGQIYDLFGEKQEAIKYYHQALPVVRALKNQYAESAALSSIGQVYVSLGEWRKALEYFNLTLPINRALKYQRDEAATLNNLGQTYFQLGEWQKGIEYYNLALSLRRKVKNRLGEAITLSNIGSVYISLGEWRKALEHFNLALPISQSVGDRKSEAIILKNIGSIYASLGDNQKALDYQNKALLLSRDVKDRVAEIDTLYAIALTERNLNNLAEARSKIEQAIDIFESLRNKLVSPGLRTSYFASAQHYYYFYVDVLMRLNQIHPGQGYDAMALHASERSRARVLLEMLMEGYTDIREGVDPVLLERERSLRRSLSAKTEQQTRLHSRNHTEQQAEQIKKEIEQLLAQHQEAEAQIRATSPRYAALTQPRPLTVEQIQHEVLDADTMLLEYALGEDQSYLWAVTPDSVVTFVLPKRADIEATAQRAYDFFAKYNRRDRPARGGKQTPRPQMSRRHSEDASRLSHTLLRPVAGLLVKKRRLLIVSDGALNYVPFAALVAPEVQTPGIANAGRLAADSSRLLIEGHEIINLPSASTLAALRQELAERKPAPKAVAVLADPVFDKDDVRVRAAIRGEVSAVNEKRGRAEAGPLLSSDSAARSQLGQSIRDVGMADGGRLPRLPFSRQEAEDIFAISQQVDAMKALDFSASRDTAVSAEMNQYRIVHFATHSLLNNEHPELSGLVMSLVNQQGEPQDGFFRLYDIYNMHLAADLVVLSACQTALGKQIKGEGLVGVTRGFMYAGAARVVASLWKVDD